MQSVREDLLNQYRSLQSLMLSTIDHHPVYFRCAPKSTVSICDQLSATHTASVRRFNRQEIHREKILYSSHHAMFGGASAARRTQWPVGDRACRLWLRKQVGGCNRPGPFTCPERCTEFHS